MSFTWSHSTNSRAKLTLALADPLVDAIEADILMGRDTTPTATTIITTSSSDGVIDTVTQLESSSTINNNTEPIMGHPPHQESDLSVATFLKMVTTTTHGAASVMDMDVIAVDKQQQKQQQHVTLQKHIKLDFKEIETVQPTLKELQNLLHPTDDCDNNTTIDTTTATSTLKKTVFLNADILPGPGKRNVAHMSSSAFLDSCLAHIAQTKVCIGCNVNLLDSKNATSHVSPFFLLFTFFVPING
jgi:Uncharacterized conserved protein (DUF2181)